LASSDRLQALDRPLAYFSATTFSVEASLQVFVMVVIGGLGSIPGALLGIVLAVVASWAFGLYVSQVADYDATYGYREAGERDDVQRQVIRPGEQEGGEHRGWQREGTRHQRKDVAFLSEVRCVGYRTVRASSS
jgi:hypothetical protein